MERKSFLNGSAVALEISMSSIIFNTKAQTGSVSRRRIFIRLTCRVGGISHRRWEDGILDGDGKFNQDADMF